MKMATWSEVKWTQETQEALEAIEDDTLRTDMAVILKVVFRMRAEAAMEKKDAEDKVSAANKQALPFFLLSGIKSLKSTNMGSLGYSTTTRTSLDKGKLAVILVEEGGLSADLASAYIERASTVSESESITYTAYKEKKGGAK